MESSELYVLEKDVISKLVVFWKEREVYLYCLKSPHGVDSSKNKYLNSKIWTFGNSSMKVRYHFPVFFEYYIE